MPSRIPRLLEEHGQLATLAERLLDMVSQPLTSVDAAVELVGCIETVLNAHLEGESGFPYSEILHRELDWSQAVKQRRERDLRDLAFDLVPFFGRWSAERIAADSVGFAEAAMWSMTRLLRRVATEDSILHAVAQGDSGVAAA